MIRPIRSGKYFLTSGGNSTLPTPRPAKVTTLPIINTVSDPARPRVRCPISIAVRASTSTFSSPSRRVNTGVKMPKTAKHTGGSIPSTPMAVALSAMSAEISPTIGERPATAVRRVKATRMMPSSARVRPAHKERGGLNDTRQV